MKGLRQILQETFAAQQTARLNLAFEENVKLLDIGYLKKTRELKAKYDKWAAELKARVAERENDFNLQIQRLKDQVIKLSVKLNEVSVEARSERAGREELQIAVNLIAEASDRGKSDPGQLELFPVGRK